MNEEIKEVNQITDEDWLFIISTTKACPNCGMRGTKYHGIYYKYLYIKTSS